MAIPAPPAVVSTFPAAGRLQDRVLWLLRQGDRPLGAYQLARKLTQASGQPHHPNSVYRVLHGLMQDGQVVPVATTKGWVAKQLPDRVPALVLLCRKCGNASQLPAAGVEDDIAPILARWSFRPRQVHIEVLGHCKACSVLTLSNAK